MKKNIAQIGLVLCGMFFGNLVYGQAQNVFPVYSYIFSEDSLKGFDEEESRRGALNLGLIQQERKVKIWRDKRNYINKKYKLINNNFYSAAKQSHNQKNSLVCNNDDFESSIPAQITSSNQITGWTITGDVNTTYTDNCNLQLCCLNDPAEGALINCPAGVGYIDPVIGGCYPIYSVFGTGENNGKPSNPQLTGKMFGTKILRVNNGLNNSSVEKLTKTISVTPSNAFFQFAYISIFYTSHGCCDGGSLKIYLTDAFTNSVLPCPLFSLSSPGVGCSTVTPVPFYHSATCASFTGTGQYIFNKWKINSIDLSPFIGQSININFMMSDCIYGGHYSYSYFDASCSPKLSVSIGDSLFVGGQDTVNVLICPNTTSVINGPPGFDSYFWNGPGGITGTNSALSTSVVGTYTLTLGQLGGCATVNKIINVNYSIQNAQIISSTPTLCLGNSATLTTSGLSAWYWGPGETGNTFIATPNNAGLITYSVSGLAAYGCTHTVFYTLFVIECVGINSNNLNPNKISIYPNPNNGEFILTIEKQIDKGEIKIENVLGQLIYSQSVTEGKNKITIKQLAPGTYYYTITQNKEPIKKGNLKIE